MTTTHRQARAVAPMVATPEPALHKRRPTAYLDLARIIAIGAVVLIHTITPLSKGMAVPLLSKAWWTANFVNAAALWAVPVFVMVSGALLLDPGRDESPPDFYRKRLSKIGVPLVAWTAFYLFFRSWFGGEHITLGTATTDILAGRPYLQLYFLFIVLGLYAITPFLRVLIGAIPRRDLRFITAGALLFGCIDYSIGDLAVHGSANAVSQFIPYIGYYLAGYLLRTIRLPEHALPASVLAFLGAVAVTALGSGFLAVHFGWNHVGTYFYGYLSPTVIVMSISAFLVFRAIQERLPDRPVPGGTKLQTLAEATFGVFLVHPVLLFPIREATGLPHVAWLIVLVVPVFAAAIAALSVAATLLMARVPGLRALV